MSLYLYYLSNIVRLLSHGLSNLSHHTSIISLLHQQYIRPFFSWNQQSISAYVTISPLHQQYNPITSSWTQQSAQHMFIISLIHQQNTPTILSWNLQSISSHVYCTGLFSYELSNLSHRMSFISLIH
jgi:hypothetical protein